MTGMTRFLSFLGVLSFVVLLPGCWSSTEIQDVSYIKALGIDYQDKQFIIYAQLLDFSNIAKTESGGVAGGNAIVWIGKGKGKTYAAAVSDLFKTAQTQLSWGHVSSILLTERVILTQGKSIVEMIGRYPEIRYNTIVYSTRSPLEKILTTTPFFRLSPIASILHNPSLNFKQDSIYPPVLFFKYISRLNEPSATSYLPSLSINSVQWKEGEKPKSLLMINGGFFYYGEHSSGFLPRNKLEGYHWLVPSMKNSPLTITKDGTQYGQLDIGKPKIKITPIVQGSEATFRIDASYRAWLYEYLNPISYNEMTIIAEDIIKKEIMETFLEGLEIGVDPFELGYFLHRKHPQLWKQLSNNGKELVIHPESIESINIHVKIPNNGRYKRQTK